MAGSEKVHSATLDFIRAFAANIAGILQSRLQLFSVEVAEEGLRLVRLLIWTVAALFCAGMAFVLINVMIVYLFWEEARLAVLICLTLFYTVLLAAIAISFTRYLKRQRPPFADTIGEFQKDWECLRKRN